jgi:hypothetical protein
MAGKPANSGKPWSEKDENKLVQLINGNTPTRVIALKLERTEDAIRSKAQELDKSLAPWNKSPYNRQK